MSLKHEKEIVAGALTHLIRKSNGDANMLAEIWCEIATFDTHGSSQLFFVRWIREREKLGSGDFWFRIIKRMVAKKLADYEHTKKFLDAMDKFWAEGAR